jgi:hypothetical protein
MGLFWAAVSSVAAMYTILLPSLLIAPSIVRLFSTVS